MRLDNTPEDSPKELRCKIPELPFTRTNADPTAVEFTPLNGCRFVL